MDDQPYGASDYMVNEVARRYAAEMVRHNLERAAELATTFADVGGYVYIDKQSITDIEIKLL